MVVTKLTLKRNAPVREVWLNPYQSQKTNIPPATGQTNNATRSVNALNIEKLRQYLNHHPDQYFVNYLVDGFTNGFDTGIQELPSSTLECKNLLSARNQTEITQSLIDKELEKGFLADPYDVMPFPIYRVNPIGVAEGKYSNKKRLIVDLSAPHNDSQNPSLNQLIDKEEYSLQYVKLDHPIDIIKSSGIILDSTSLEARLPVNKVQWINNILVSFLDKKSCTKRELLSLLGHLNFAS